MTRIFAGISVPSLTLPSLTLPSLTLLSLSLLACAPQTESGPTSAPCKVGQVLGCACEGGGQGEKTCKDDGTFTACVCIDTSSSDGGEGGNKPDAITASDTQQPQQIDTSSSNDSAILDSSSGNDATADAGPDVAADTAPPVQLAGQVTTVAGSGAQGQDDGDAAKATFQRPLGVAWLAKVLYVADYQGNRLRAVSNGQASTVAGSVYGMADGKAAQAQFRHPAGLAVDGKTLLIADRDNHRIRRFDPATGAVSTVAGSGEKGYFDGAGASAKFAGPEGLEVDATGQVYVADTQNNRVRRINKDGSVISSIRGGLGFADGPVNSAKLAFPADIAVHGARVYVADAVNHAIRYLDVPKNEVFTLAGNKTAGGQDGKGQAAQFNLPRGVAVDGKGNVFVSEAGGHRLRKVTADGMVTTIAGASQGFADGAAETALFNQPWGIASDGDTTLWVADSANRRARKYFLAPVGN